MISSRKNKHSRSIFFCFQKKVEAVQVLAYIGYLIEAELTSIARRINSKDYLIEGLILGICNATFANVSSNRGKYCILQTSFKYISK